MLMWLPEFATALAWNNLLIRVVIFKMNLKCQLVFSKINENSIRVTFMQIILDQMKLKLSQIQTGMSKIKWWNISYCHLSVLIMTNIQLYTIQDCKTTINPTDGDSKHVTHHRANFISILSFFPLPVTGDGGGRGGDIYNCKTE